MSRVFPYNCAKYSVIDMIEFLRKKDFNVELVDDPRTCDKFHVLGTDVFLDVPTIGSKGGDILMDVRLEDVRLENNQVKYTDELSKKVYAMLRRKFRMKESEEWPTVVKDFEALQKIATIRYF